MRGGVNNSEVAQAKLLAIYKATLDPTSNKVQAGHGYMGVYTKESGEFSTVKWMTHRLERGFNNRWNMMRMNSAQGDAAFLASEKLAKELHELAREIRPEAVGEVDRILQNYTEKNQYGGRSLLSRAVVYQAVRVINNGINITQEEKARLDNDDDTRVNTMGTDRMVDIVISSLNVPKALQRFLKESRLAWDGIILDSINMKLKMEMRSQEWMRKFEKAIESVAKTVIRSLVETGRSRKEAGESDNDVEIALAAIKDQHDLDFLADDVKPELARVLLNVLVDAKAESRAPTFRQLNSGLTVEIEKTAPYFNMSGSRCGYGALVAAVGRGEVRREDLFRIVRQARGNGSEHDNWLIVDQIEADAYDNGLNVEEVFTIPGPLIDGKEPGWKLTRKDLSRLVQDGQLTPFGVVSVTLHLMSQSGKRVTEQEEKVLRDWASGQMRKSVADTRAQVLADFADKNSQAARFIYSLYSDESFLPGLDPLSDYDDVNFDGFHIWDVVANLAEGDINNDKLCAALDLIVNERDRGSVGPLSILLTKATDLDTAISLLDSFDANEDIALNKYRSALADVFERALFLRTQKWVLENLLGVDE